MNVGTTAAYKDCKQFFGKELTFKELCYEPGTQKLLILMMCTVNGIEEDDDIYVGQITRVVDHEEGYEECASAILDIPGWDQRPFCVDFEDMEFPDLDEDDDPEVITNCYTRIWRLRKPLPALEQLAIGAAAYGKCKNNLIDTTEDLLEAFRTGAIKTVLKSDALRSVKQVLTVAGIEIPEEEPQQEQQETAIVAAQPAELDPVMHAKQLHQRILADAQSAAESIWDMSKAIKEMRDGKHYKALLFDNFEGYCEEALGMSRSHAYRYIQIAEGMSAENVAQLAQIGTTKLALLASVTDDQREIVTTAVDVESATVRELKAQIDALKHQNEQTEAALEDAEGRAQRWCDDAEEKRQKIEEQNGRFVKDQQEIAKLNAEIYNNQSFIAKLTRERTDKDSSIEQLQARITELESRPVEVAVQEDSEALEQLRKEYEEKLAELKADTNYTELLAMVRLVRTQVNTLCTRLSAVRSSKEKETLIKYVKEIGLMLGQLN